MKVILKEGFEYIPEWNNNKKQPKAEQCKVNFRFQSAADLDEVLDDKGAADKRKDWLSICVSIENLNINGKDIKPEDIYDMDGLLDLFLELKSAYRLEASIDKKK